eukprot:1455053-Rhodomonas_salina.2
MRRCVPDTNTRSHGCAATTLTAPLVAAYARVSTGVAVMLRVRLCTVIALEIRIGAYGYN